MLKIRGLKDFPQAQPLKLQKMTIGGKACYGEMAPIAWQINLMKIPPTLKPTTQND